VHKGWAKVHQHLQEVGPLVGVEPTDQHHGTCTGMIQPDMRHGVVLK
jgi:hypothetical protein